MQYLDDKYSDPVKDQILDMCSLVDPRFRTTYIDPDNVEQVKKRSVAELMGIVSSGHCYMPPGMSKARGRRQACLSGKFSLKKHMFQLKKAPYTLMH